MPESTGASVFDSRFFWAYVACFALQCLAVVAMLVVGYLANLSDQKKGIEMAEAKVNAASVPEEDARTKEQTDALMAQVDSALSEREKLQQAYAELSRRLEQEKTARREVEERLAPRHIPSGQVQAVAEAIAGFAGSKVSIVASPTDTESRSFAQQLAEVLEKAGWISKTLTSVAADSVHSGVAIETARPLDAGATDSLFDALKRAGVHVERTSAPRIYGDSILILVGCKP